MTDGVGLQKLGEICTLINGRAYSKNELLAQGKYPVLRVGNFFTNKNWYYSDLELSPDKYCDTGDLLYAWSASFGPRIWEGEKAIFHYHIWKVVPDATKVDKLFLYYFLMWDTEQIKNDQGAGTTMIHVAKGSMEERMVFVPPLSAQRRIVAILDEAFEAIATAKANAEKNLQNAREVFDSKLYDLLAKGSGGWARKTLREVATDFGRGKSKHRPRNDPKLYGGPYPFIQTGDVRGAEHLITEYTQTYSEAGLAQSKLWPRGTLCITIAANIAETGVLGFDACFPDSVIGVVVDDAQTSSKYLEYMLHTVKAQLKAKGKGSAQDNINLGTFESERFPFPDLATQARIVGLLDELSFEVQRLEGLFELKLIALDELKKSLLHQAFTGQL